MNAGDECLLFVTRESFEAAVGRKWRRLLQKLCAGHAEAVRATRGAPDGAMNDGRFGGPCRGRTYDLLIKSQLLYQLS